MPEITDQEFREALKKGIAKSVFTQNPDDVPESLIDMWWTDDQKKRQFLVNFINKLTASNIDPQTQSEK